MRLGPAVALLTVLSSAPWGGAPSAVQALTAHFEGRVVAGQVYTRAFGNRFVFSLVPERDADGRWLGWNIRVEERGRLTDLAGMTPPWRGEGPLQVRPGRARVGTRAAPQVFIFSPEVERTIGWDMVDGADTRPEVITALLRRIEAFGRGEFLVLDASPPGGAMGAVVGGDTMTFEVTLRWQRDVPRPLGVRSIPREQFGASVR